MLYAPEKVGLQPRSLRGRVHFKELEIRGSCHLGLSERQGWAEIGQCLLNFHGLQNVVGVQFQRSAPQWRLEDVVHKLACVRFTGLGKQTGPF